MDFNSNILNIIISNLYSSLPSLNQQPHIQMGMPRHKNVGVVTSTRPSSLILEGGCSTKSPGDFSGQHKPTPISIMTHRKIP